jgi:hypothetical protein
MPRPSKRNLRLASIASIGGMAKRLKSILPVEPEEALSGFSDHEEEINSQWEVDESGDSDVSSSSDDDEPKV